MSQSNSTEPTLYNATDLEVGKQQSNVYNTNTIPSTCSYLPIMTNTNNTVPMSSTLTYNPSAKFDRNEPVSYQPQYAVSYVNPKLEARTGNVGCGIFCISPVKQGDTLIVWTGRIVSTADALYIMNTDDKHYILQVGDGFYQLPLGTQREPADWTNHSCAPTAGFGKNSPICLSAMCDMEVGDEVVFDYGMCETDERLWEPMQCECGASTCRGMITANDYKRRELWDRYDGYWSPHVQKLVDQLKLDELIQQQKLQTTITIDHNYGESHSTNKLLTDTDCIDTTSNSDSDLSSDATTSNQSVVSDVYDCTTPTQQAQSLSWFDKVLMKIGLVRVQNVQKLIGNNNTNNYQKHYTG